MNTEATQSPASLGSRTGSPVPDRVCVPQSEWDALDEVQRQFLVEAENGGMRYIAENGAVIAWGAAYEGLFSMDVDAEKHSEDGYLVTLAENA